MSRIAFSQFAFTIAISGGILAGCNAEPSTAESSHIRRGVAALDSRAAVERNLDDSNALDGADDDDERPGLSDYERAGLKAIRQVTGSYDSLDAANAAGYTVWSPNPFAPNATCPSNALGNMGYHLVNVPLRGAPGNPAAGNATIDLLHPQMLLYEKEPDGEMHLVGVEYLVFKAAWERVHGVGAAPPEILGHPLLSSSHTFVPGGPSIPHYELHVWAWSKNPLGMFAPWNPTITC